MFNDRRSESPPLETHKFDVFEGELTPICAVVERKLREVLPDGGGILGLKIFADSCCYYVKESDTCHIC
jgi:hypothetical protein